MCFPNNIENNAYILALLNSKVCEYIMEILSPTLDFNQGAMGKMPLFIVERIYATATESCLTNVALCKYDWDNFETSWDFQVHPLIPTREERSKHND